MTRPPTHRRHRFRQRSIVVLGVSTSGTTGTEGRELALGPDGVVRVSSRLGELYPNLEHVVIATCDRTELVVASQDGLSPGDAIDVWHRALGVEFAGHRAPCLAPAARPFVLTGADAVRHVLRVACGLESSLLGDSDILGQLRTAWGHAEAAGTTGPVTRAVFRDAFATGRRARATTDISAGGAGVGSAVASAVGASPDRHVLIVGAGPAGRTIARRLAKDTASTITIANRTISHAEALASEVGGRTVPMVALDDALLDAEVVVTAVATHEPILTSQRLAALRLRRPGWSPLIVDVGAPANVEPTDGFDVVGLDALSQRTNVMTDRRCAAVPIVEQFIAEILDRRYGGPFPRTDRSTPLAGISSADTARRSSLS